ncbi:MAG: M28 family metallopeptidase [Ilyomonas sp.]
MRYNTFSAFVLAFIVLTVSCKQEDKNSTDQTSLFSKDSLAKYIQVLASDSFQGRKPFTVGETRTVEYLERKFKEMGVEPGNNGSYVQDVPMVDITATADPVMKVEAPSGSFELHNTIDYVVGTERTDAVISLDKDELVFAGFGIVAPEYNWNDYAGIDVKGKVVLVLVNDPGFQSGDSTLFKGNTMTYYGRWTYKFEEAERQGAKACLIIHNTAAASYPFSVLQTSYGSSNMFLDTRGSNDYHLALQGWVTGDAANKLLQAAGKDSSLIASAHKRGFKAVPLNEKLSTKVRVKAVYNKSKNVIAKLTGIKHPDEYVVYTAHWDHFGIGKPDAKGDSIFNGALDNASGTAALIEMARAFANEQPKPERTILFLAVTAEEQGLLGSAYYAQHPVYPLNKTLAELNMDVINVWDRTKDISIAGQGQSELEDYLLKEAQKQGRYIAPEAHPEAGHYFRSDHFNFAKAGVPALNAASGVDDAEKGKDYGRQLEDDYNEHRYHQPSDEYNPAWTFEGTLQDMQILSNIGNKVASAEKWPEWKEGSEFKAIREKSK